MLGLSVLLLLQTASPDSLRAQAVADSVPRSPSVSALAIYNSGFPSAQRDGPVWAGRGTTLVLSGEWGWANRFLSVRLAPQLWGSQNVSTSLIPQAGTTSPNPYADPLRPRAIDLPQRFGEGALSRLEPGNSEIALHAYGLRAALTSASRRIGVGEYHAIVMSPDAPGFARVELGTRRPWRTPVGDFAGTLSAGRLPQSPWAPDRRTGARSGSFLEGRWRPFSSPLVELGGVRFYHKDWQGFRIQDLATPFGSLFFDDQIFGDGDADNQLLAVFGAVRIPQIGLELWAEFGKNDRSANVRDLTVELDHASAWLFGFKRTWTDEVGRRWVVNGAGASARIPPTVRFRPPLATFYDHYPLSQGHTNRGQLLGSYLLERTGGAEVRVDRHSAAERVALVVMSRNLGQTLGLDIPEDRLRQEWSVFAEWETRKRGRLDYFVRTGFIADLNRHPTFGDAYSAVLSTGVTFRP